MTVTIKLGAIVAAVVLTASAGAGEIEAPQQPTDGEAGLTGQPLAPAADASSELGVSEPDALAPAAAAEDTTSKSVANEAQARGLTADKKDEAAPVRICRREKTTGTRLGRKRCSTVKQLQRAADLQGAKFEQGTNRFERVPYQETGREPAKTAR